MVDRDHLAETHGYVNPMAALAAASLNDALSSLPRAEKMLALTFTHDERLHATTPELTRLLILRKLQERF